MDNTMTVLESLLEEIKDDDIRTILSISSKNRKYPKDCITDGGLEKLVRYILALERK
jgi:hypothetical protein